MGIYDREYYQEDETSGRFSMGSIAKWPWSYRILGLCVIIFFLDHLIPADGQVGRLGDSIGFFSYWGMYSTSQVFGQLQIWRVFTFIFVDPDPRHFLCSMIGLFFFGPPIEAAFGRSRFLVFFLLCGMASALFGSLICPALFGREAFLFGALGSVLGLIVAAGVLTPHQTVIFMFIIPMTMRTLAILCVLIDAGYAVSGFTEGACNLGGALAGFILTRNRHWLSFVDRLPGLPAMGKGRATLPFKNITKAFETKPVSEDELDRLLDKVHAHGIESLTANEKATLKRASKQRRRSF